MSTTILLLQTSGAAGSRTYLDFASPGQCYDAIARMYEERLRAINPNSRSHTYDVQDLFRYLDSLTDVSMLVLDAPSGKFEPFPRDYVKRGIYDQLKRAAVAASRQGGGGGGWRGGGGRR
jgi:hypothetical protein